MRLITTTFSTAKKQLNTREQKPQEEYSSQKL
ncbi:MAG: hypothetical protein ACJAYD_000250, partial [Patiriisocius sp.]